MAGAHARACCLVRRAGGGAPGGPRHLRALLALPLAFAGGLRGALGGRGRAKAARRRARLRGGAAEQRLGGRVRRPGGRPRRAARVRRTCAQAPARRWQQALRLRKR